MSTDVNYSIKGTTDVPQQVDKSKKAMSDLERQTAAVQKKFTDFGKDLFMSFFAPMVLIHQAINFITSAIAQAKQDAKDAVDFAAGIKVEEMKTSPVDAATRYLAQRLKVEIRTEEEQKQAAKARQVVTEEFLKRDPRGRVWSAVGHRRRRLRHAVGQDRHRLAGEVRQARDRRGQHLYCAGAAA